MIVLVSDIASIAVRKIVQVVVIGHVPRIVLVAVMILVRQAVIQAAMKVVDKHAGDRVVEAVKVHVIKPVQVLVWKLALVRVKTRVIILLNNRYERIRRCSKGKKEWN